MSFFSLVQSAISPRLHPVAYWCVILIPITAAVSRFAADLMLSITAVCFLIHVALTRRTDWLKIRWVQVALILWLYVLVRGFFAFDMEGALGRAASWLRFPIFAAAMMVWVLQTPAQMRTLIYSLSAAVGFMLLDTALQYFTGTDLLGWDSIPSDGSPRLTGPFSSPRVGIMLVWMAIPPMAYWLMEHGGNMRHGRALWLGAFFTIGTLTVIFMSGERMALLLTGLAFLLAFILLPIRKRTMLAMGLVGALCMGALAYTNPGLVERQLGSTTEVVGEFEGSDYGQIWQSAITLFKQYPIFGAGLRQFRELCPTLAFDGMADVASRCNQHTHNIYLEWLAEAGIIGIGLFMLMIGFIARDAWRLYPQLKTHPLFIGLLITVFIRLWPLASNTSFFTAWSAVPMWLMLGWLVAVMHRARKDQPV